MPQVVEVLDDVLADGIVDIADVARVLGMNVRSVARWRVGEVAARRESEERLLELKSVLILARKHLRPESARLWLRSPNPDLDYNKPVDLIAEANTDRSSERCSPWPKAPLRRTVADLVALVSTPLLTMSEVYGWATTSMR